MHFPAELLNRVQAKARQSSSQYRIGACAISKKGDILGFAMNTPQRPGAVLEGKYTGQHAEAALIKRYGENIKTIIVSRIGLGGDLRPIEPCEKCAKLAKKYNIKIVPVKPD